MASLAKGFGYIGSLGDISAYRMQGVDRIVVRTKGGASKDKIRNHPSFVRTRENNQEWKACTMAARMVNNAMLPVKHLADHNYAGALTAVCKSIQLDESVSRRGERGIPFSQSLYKLEGFGLNKYHVFDAILRHPLQYEIGRQTGTAIVQLPRIMPGINLQNPRKQAMFRFVFTLGMLPDVVFQPGIQAYKPVTDIQPNSYAVANTPWCAFEAGCDAQQLLLSVNGWQMQEHLSLILAAGVEFGQPVSTTEVKTTKYAGAAKLLKLV
jgi:hypothetical protein